MLSLAPLSFGVGDRFAHQARAQLAAFQKLAAQGIEVVPVWNKSHREHTFIGSQPADVRAAALSAVAALGWNKAWHVDADHIRMQTVDAYLESADFFTIDVAASIGQAVAHEEVARFLDRHPELSGEIAIPGIERPFLMTQDETARIAAKYLAAAMEAGTIYKHIECRKGPGAFIAEVSMDETDHPQTPPELLLILAALADAGVQPATIAPKFTGRFNKGVDYVGDLAQFEIEFHDDIAVLAEAVRRYSLPGNLKLSVHSGSDKFSLYPIIHRTLAKFRAGVHVKTAGTTWLEEIIGLAEAGGEALAFAKELYAAAFSQVEKLCAPYASVIDIDPAKLPGPDAVYAWTSEQFVRAIRHVPSDPLFHSGLRQLIHVSFKLAAQAGRRYLDLLEDHAETVARNVTLNIYERHLRPLFLE
jgi:hypothetical protein